MPVTNSSYVIDAHAQADGTHYVLVMHTDSTGFQHRRHFAIPSGEGDTEVQAIMAKQAAALDVSLAEAEAEQLIGS